MIGSATLLAAEPPQPRRPIRPRARQPRVTKEASAGKGASGKKVNPALMRPLQPSKELAAVVGSKPLPRAEVVSKAVVRQRLKLVAVSPKLLDLYAENAMTLEQLTAFTGAVRPLTRFAPTFWSQRKRLDLLGRASLHNNLPGFLSYAAEGTG